MRIAPLAWNFNGNEASIASAAGLFSRGKPAANSADIDTHKLCEWRGAIHVEAGVNDKSNFTDSAGGALTATLNAGTYNSVAEYCIELARAHNTAASLTAYSFWQEQGSADRYRIKAARAGGTVSFQINTGAQAATNALRLSGGYRDADRSAAAAHVGDFAVCHDYDTLLLDFGALATRYVGDGSFVYRPTYSPAASYVIRGGNTTATSNVEQIATGHADDRIIYIPYSVTTYQLYIELRIYDPHRESRQRGSIAYWYHGPVFDTERTDEVDGMQWEWQSYQTQHVQRARVTDGVSGQPHWAEIAPGRIISASLDVSPGLSPNYAAGLQNLVKALGVETYAFVALDPTNEPQRETYLCRVAQAPTFQRVGTQSQLGRYRVGLMLEVVEQ